MNIATTRPTRLIIAALFGAVVGGAWDVWWHGMLGRESFFAPPHILLYISVAVAFLSASFYYYKTKESKYGWLILSLASTPVAFVLDELWHRVFGVEAVSSSLIFWSPPHLVIIFCLVASFVVALLLMRSEEDVSVRHIFEALCFAGIFMLLSFITRPFYPLGPYHVLGFWGVGFSAALLCVMLLAVKKWMAGPGTAFLFITFVCLVSSMIFGEKLSMNPLIPLQAYPPSWLQVFALVIPALAADLIYHVPLWLKGGLLGFLNAGTMYFFAWRFIEPQFQYSTYEMLTAVLAGAIGGIVAAALLSLVFIKIKQ